MVIETRTTQGETRKGSIAQFSVLETIFWASLCTLAFNVLLLRDSGFTSVEVGLMMAINNVVAIIAPIIWGYLADRFNRIKTLFLIANVLVMFSTLVLPLCADRTVLGVPLIAVTMAVFQMAYAGSYSLLDAWVVSMCNERKGKWIYSHIRMWGAVGYAFVSMLLTYVAQQSSIRIAYYTAVVISIGVLIWTCKMPEPESAERLRKEKERVMVFELLKRPKYVLLLVYNFIFHISLYAASTFIPYLMSEVGLDASFASALSGIRGLAEIPIYIASAFLIRKIKPQRILILAGVLYCVEHASYLVATNLSMVIAAQILGGLAYGMFLSVAPQTAASLAPEPLHASSQTLMASLVFAGNIVASFLSGWIIEIGSAEILYTVTAVLQVFVTIFYTASTLVQPIK